ncbi:MAG: hypothetical protein M1831_001693 [Alyxoria varia]|nr:MAG: hypothetical protein M1831_001693 [Alyxoria varia]
MRKENVDWLHELKPDWTPYIYTASSPPEPGYPLRPPGYRGREAITYLSFIIDNYDSLPPYVAFVHAGATQWHNDILGPDTSAILRNIRFDMVDRRGYVNLRCKHDPGCPVGVAPFDPTDIDIRGKDIRAYFVDVYMELFNVPSSEVPHEIGNVCCGQFVVSRQRIRDRPKSDYERMRRWALESSVTHSFGVGWVFEKVWHIIFGMEAKYCPDVEAEHAGKSSSLLERLENLGSTGKRKLMSELKHERARKGKEHEKPMEEIEQGRSKEEDQHKQPEKEEHHEESERSAQRNY